jgi:hypothetical protein
MNETMDIGYPLVVLMIAAGLGVLGLLPSHFSDRMVRRATRELGFLAVAEPAPDLPLREALEAVRFAPRR